MRLLASIFLVMFSVLPTKAWASQVPLQAHCRFEEKPPKKIASIDDFGVVQFEDESALKLADLFVPLDDKTGKFLPSTLKRLRQLTVGASAQVVVIGEADRYGKQHAFIFLYRDQNVLELLQEKLILEELAVYMPRPASKKTLSTDCDLFALQMGLRALDGKHTLSFNRKRGDLVSTYSARSRRLWDLEGEFTLVRGTVTDMRQTRRGISLNFGDNWKRDFTAYLSVSVSKELENSHGKNLDLVGQRMQLRGFMDLYYGPAMRIDHLMQMEMLSK